jgi:hypothetical protein
LPGANDLSGMGAGIHGTGLPGQAVMQYFVHGFVICAQGAAI